MTNPQLDYSRVQAYWKIARPSMLGPYMMDGFGFPSGAGDFRFRAELKVVNEAIKNINPTASVLDLGSGVGVWTEYFAQRFDRVVSVEGSPTLFNALTDRCSPYPNVAAHNADVLPFNIETNAQGGFGLVFLGGLLMYLNDLDIKAIFAKLIPHLTPNAIVLCRESTIRQGVRTLQGDYQVAYRSVETYRTILNDAGFDIENIQTNEAYINAQMGCELIKKWKAIVPKRIQGLPIVGRLTYWGLRTGYPWSTRFIPWSFKRIGVDFPNLTNHFFILRPKRHPVHQTQDRPSQAARKDEQQLEDAR